MRARPPLRAWVWPPPPVARRLWLVIAGASAYCLLVYWLGQGLITHLPAWSSEFGLVNGIVLGVLVAVRTRAAFDRWFEGQRLWGELMFHCRNLALKAAHLTRAGPEDRRQFGLLIIGFVRAVVARLQDRPVRAEDWGVTKPPPPGVSNVPACLAGRLLALAARWQADGRLDLPGLWAIEANVRALTDTAGHCDRVAHMPVPTSFHVLLRHGLLLSLVLAPWHLIFALGLWAVPVQALIIYFLFGVELTAEEIENPFGTDVDDLPLATYCETIRRDVLDILGANETDASTAAGPAGTPAETIGTLADDPPG